MTNDHVNFLVVRGIANTVLGNVETGRYLLQQAQDWYQRITTPWAQTEERRISSWLAYSNTTMLSKLREDAQ